MKCVSLVPIFLCSCLILSSPVRAQVSFYQPMTYPDCPFGPLFANDFNGDGKLDRLCGYGVLDLGNGDGTFNAGTPPAG